MKKCLPLLFLLFQFYPWISSASIDFGVGTSSVTYGRPIAGLAFGYHSSDWGMNYRAEGVQTTIYAQNSWTAAGYKVIDAENLGPGNATVGLGFGGTYIYRTYRTSLTEKAEATNEYVLGPYLSLKYQLFGIFIGADTLLGMRPETFFQHVVLNFQDVSHITIGFSL